jgi:S1-C subfamily serine protease
MIPLGMSVSTSACRSSARRVDTVACLLATAAAFFTLGLIHARGNGAVAQRLALQSDVRETRRSEPLVADATVGRVVAHKDEPVDIPTPAARAKMVAEIKQEIQDEMGLLPVHLLRERRASFVELYAYDTSGQKSYGTAGYLGRGYFVTVKHAVVALAGDTERGTRTMTAVKIVYKGTEIPARVIDTGDADVEVHSGDWAIIKTKELDLPALHVDTSFAYDFAEPIFRLGNDYSKGIILSTGYVGQRTSTGLVTCLTDGHPGVSGGGVLDQRGDLVGIPIGRMQGDYRFSFILPMRAEMLRKVSVFDNTERGPVPAEPQ